MLERQLKYLIERETCIYIVLKLLMPKTKTRKMTHKNYILLRNIQQKGQTSNGQSQNCKYVNVEQQRASA